MNNKNSFRYRSFLVNVPYLEQITAHNIFVSYDGHRKFATTLDKYHVKPTGYWIFRVMVNSSIIMEV